MAPNPVLLIHYSPFLFDLLGIFLDLPFDNRKFLKYINLDKNV